LKLDWTLESITEYNLKIRKRRENTMIINANGTEISILKRSNNFDENYISLTDIARRKNPYEPKDVVKNWMRLRSTIDYLGLWEQLNNPNFKGVEFDTFRKESGTNSFTLTPQRWIETTNAIGIISKSGRYGGTYAHSDIAFEFASWISPEFKLYIIKDYQRLKKDEADRLALGWDSKRVLSKINYRIHTDAIKEFLITPELTPQEINYKYASVEQLIILVNIESLNADMIHDGISMEERLKK
jgi:hypothetical protein